MSTWLKNSIAAAVTVLLLGACTVGPDFTKPSAPAVARYLPSGDLPGDVTAIGQTQHFDLSQSPDADWWHLFGSSELDQWVSTAIAGNPSLQSAQASLRESQDNLRAGQGIFFPQLGVGADATRERTSPSMLGQHGIGGIFNLFTLSATVSYALDLFGSERRTVEGLHAAVDMHRYTMEGTYLTLTGNVVNTAIARQAYADEIDVMHGLVSLQTQQLGLVDTRIQSGAEVYSDLLTLRSARASNLAQLASLELKRDQADHLLHALLGQSAGESQLPAIRFEALHLPASLPVSLPSDLVHQRPDILAAEAQLHEASAEIGVATAAMFPSITLGGDDGSAANTTGALGKSQGRYWSAGADISMPVFQGGTRWYNRKAAIDAYQKSLQDYRGTVLTAFEQVADVLKALQHDAEAMQANDEAARDAAQALSLIQANYTAGLVNYVDVLIADEQYRQSKMAYVQALAQRYQDAVALYVALGGGWWKAPHTEAMPASTHAAQASRVQP
ncbi:MULTISPECIES: efflux transporter outer membrane subunit [unclassified Rhodanobacter]|uniref:efflux transporter outer membrane subunit n=1 Tax=unclassified Rhodanobacter TaxID=2621553 RepID=UPI00098701A5|nr:MULTISPECIES: efflux transporter outer membrane subunit [unclassified Rhodanobacter]